MGLSHAITYTADRIPQMTSATTPIGIVSASSTYGGYNVWAAFDDSDSSAWCSTTSTGWLAYEFASPKIIKKYTIYPWTSYLARAPKNFTFEGWDGSQWVVLDTRTNITDWANYVKKEFHLSNTTPYKKYRLNVTANNGNTWLAFSEMEMMEAIQSTLDTTPPTVTASPVGGTYNAPVDVTLTANESANIYYTLDGSAPTISSTLYSTPINISTNTTLKFIGQDTAGNVSAVETENYIIDTVAPTVNVDSPTNGSTVSGTVAFNVSASDENGIANVEFYIDGLKVGEDSVAPYVYSWDTTTYTEDYHNLKATVYDTVYNSSSASSIVFVDRTVPAISNVSVTTTTTKAIITWTTDEPADSQVEWGQYNGWGNFTPLDSNMVTSHTVVVEGLKPNTYYNFRIMSRDRAGNLATYDRTFVGTSKLAATYVKEWLLNGPYENTQTSVLETDYLNGEDQVLPSERQVQNGNTWAKLVSTTDSKRYL